MPIITCYHFKFVLFVTGRGEEQHLPKLFRQIAASGLCSFVVKEFIGQRRPITSPRRIARMVRSGQKLSKKDFYKFAPARQYIEADPCNRILFIDDLEASSRDEANEKFSRYRIALDTVLGDKKERASVHFFANMLEAYFFAHPEAVNFALEVDPPIQAYDGDVEAIVHPKDALEEILNKVGKKYDEIESSGMILNYLELEEVLSDPNTCVYLRTCVKWIVDQIR